MNPFREIWVRTDETIDYFLIPENRKQFVFELIWISAFVYGLKVFVISSDGWGISLFILVCVVVVVFLRFFAPWILMKSGILFKGKATIDEMRIVVSLSSIPAVIELFYLLLVAIVPGEQPVFFYPVFIVTLIFWLRILVKGVAKAQRIPVTSAFVSVFVPFFASWALLSLVAYVITK